MHSTNVSQKLNDLPRWSLWLGVTVVIIIVVIVMVRFWPVGPDYYYTYYGIAKVWLNGETRLYDAQSRGFFNAPWLLILLVPFTWLPLPEGEVILNVLSILGMLAAIHLMRDSDSIPVYAIILSIANLHVFDLLIRGQIDVLILVGIGVGWFAIRHKRPWLLSLAFWLMAIKPQSILLVGALFLWGIRRWPLSYRIRALTLPLLSLLIAGVVIGFDWPIRYINNVYEHPPLIYLQTTIWQGLSQLRMPLWPLLALGVVAVAAFVNLVRLEGISKQTLGVALSTNLVFTPYALGYHYILLIPVFLQLACQNWKLSLLIYLITWSPLLRLSWGFDIAPVDALYPVALLLVSWLMIWQNSTFNTLKIINIMKWTQKTRKNDKNLLP